MKKSVTEFLGIVGAGLICVACVLGVLLYLAFLCAIPIALVGGILWVVLWVLRSFGVI